ncbi:hypothetical protein [Croceicoccus sp. YJ47]|uniref:hypothetical protein n=1 Tax=Croceicoccus sp. YJ47 TaxID=2798724 RepID=UPI0019242675|nr:hypothetical protein [Croceicoccus sp. YJ47]QQN73520.1 hypothetical protein JD971_11970 [Croceicoccus sp. YJ47]
MVDVCSGIQLDPSLVTDVIATVNQPVIGNLESVLGGLTLGVVDLGLSDALDDARNGDPIAVTVLDSDGQIVGPGDCDLAADSLSLNAQGGIAIGGNAITGLGANGRPASAGALDAIAFGNGARTASGAGGAIAIGTGADADAANSVAIGSGAVASRGALTGYTVDGLAGTQSSVGEFSVGAPGAERQITNVAPGTQASDVATVGQVQGALDAIAGVDTRAVQYDSAQNTLVTLAGSGGTRITNVASGAIAAGSSDAINGAQLFATNQDVAGNTSAIANLDTRISDTNVQVAANSIDIANLGTRIDNIAAGGGGGGGGGGSDAQFDQIVQTVNAIDQRVSTANTTITNLQTQISQLLNAEPGVVGEDGDVVVINEIVETVTENTTMVENLEQIVEDQGDDAAAMDVRIASNTTNIERIEGQLDTVPVTYVSDADDTVRSDVPTNTVAFIAADGETVRVTDVAAGDVSSGSTDAVNGAQLAATNAAVAANRTDIDDISTSLRGSTVVAVQYSNADQ